MNASIKTIILERWNACGNDAERYEFLAEINVAKDELRKRAMRSEYNLRSSILRLEDTIDAMVFGRMKPPRPDRTSSYRDEQPILPALIGHIWALFMLREDSRQRVHSEFYAARAGKDSVMHEYRVDDAMEHGVEPQDIHCAMCDAKANQPCTKLVNKDNQ